MSDDVLNDDIEDFDVGNDAVDVDSISAGENSEGDEENLNEECAGKRSIGFVESLDVSLEKGMESHKLMPMSQSSQHTKQPAKAMDQDDDTKLNR
jgi:hypothetical protein